MNRCLETDTLAAVGLALEWETKRPLQHLADCEDCRTRLRQLATVHHAVSGQLQTAPEFVDQVMRTLPPDERTTAAANRFGVSIVLNPILAAATTFFAGALAGSTATTARPGLALIVASGVAAVGTFWWNWTKGGRVKHLSASEAT